MPGPEEHFLVFFFIFFMSMASIRFYMETSILINSDFFYTIKEEERITHSINK